MSEPATAYDRVDETSTVRATFTSYRGDDPSSGEHIVLPSWNEAFARLIKHGDAPFRGEHVHPSWSAARLEPLYRKNENVVALSALVIDVDGGVDLETLVERWGAFYGLIHTTRRHTAECPRARVIVPYTREVSPAEHQRIWRHATLACGHPVDKGTKDPSRFWYVPGSIHGQFHAIRLGGRMLDPDFFLRRVDEAANAASTNGGWHGTPYALAALHKECRAVSTAQNGQRNNRLFVAACTAGNFVITGALEESYARALLEQAAAECGLPPGETRKTIESGLRQGKTSARDAPPREPNTNNEKQESRAEQTSDGPVSWRPTSEIFAPLPPVEWRVPGLQIGPGRPTLIAGYGSSAKTLSAQSLALAVASGTDVWGKFATNAGDVRHLDYEQGWHASALRYQRLALGHGIARERLAERLRLAILPSIYLDSNDAVDAYAKACEGASLVILDALRGATPSTDENDSRIRLCLDNLTRVSERTGTAFAVLHHSAKPKEGHSDPRTIARGSSAIFDACGSVFVILAAKGAPRRVAMVKSSALATGAPLEDFSLVVEDVEIEGNPTAGVRVLWQPDVGSGKDPAVEADAKYRADAERLIEVIRANPGATQNVIAGRSSMGRTRAIGILNALEDEGRLHVVLGERRAKTYRVRVP